MIIVHSLIVRSSAGRVDAFKDFRRNDWRLTQSGMVSKSTSSAAPRHLAAAERSSVTSASLIQSPSSLSAQILVQNYRSRTHDGCNLTVTTAHKSDH